MRKTIVLDFDGVIHAYSRGWADGSIYDPPVIGAFDAIRRLMNHFNVCIVSCRDPEQIKQWLTEQAPDLQSVVASPKAHFWNFEGMLGIANHKVVASVYIDDNGIRFTDWPSALAMTYLRTGNFDVLRDLGIEVQ